MHTFSFPTPSTEGVLSVTDYWCLTVHCAEHRPDGPSSNPVLASDTTPSQESLIVFKEMPCPLRVVTRSWCNIFKWFRHTNQALALYWCSAEIGAEVFLFVVLYTIRWNIIAGRFFKQVFNVWNEYILCPNNPTWIVKFNLTLTFEARSYVIPNGQHSTLPRSVVKLDINIAFFIYI